MTATHLKTPAISLPAQKVRTDGSALLRPRSKAHSSQSAAHGEIRTSALKEIHVRAHAPNSFSRSARTRGCTFDPRECCRTRDTSVSSSIRTSGGQPRTASDNRDTRTRTRAFDTSLYSILRPQTTGRAERFIQTLIRHWALRGAVSQLVAPHAGAAYLVPGLQSRAAFGA